MIRAGKSLILFAVGLGLFPGNAPAGKTARPAPPPLIVTFIDVGQGDSALIESAGKTALVDGGPKKAAAALVQFLASRGVKKLDLVIATHPDADHIGGLPAVLEAFPADLFIDPGKGHTTYLYQELLRLLRKKKIVYEPARAGDIHEVGGAKMEILNPTNRLPEDSNNSSVVARVVLGKVSVLLTGDAEGKAEEDMINRGCNLKSTLLKAGHHGSRNSTSYIFLSRVRPEAVVLSYAAKNAFGHPDPETVRLIGVFRAAIYRTAQSGNITLETDGENYSLYTDTEEKAWRELKRRGEERSKTDINEATPDELAEVPFLSGAKAEAIVEYREMVRPFETVEELAGLAGIGPYIVDRIRDLLTVGGAAATPPASVATPHSPFPTPANFPSGEIR